MSLLWGLRFIIRAPAIPLMIGGEPEIWALFTRGLAHFSAPPACGDGSKTGGGKCGRISMESLHDPAKAMTVGGPIETRGCFADL